MNTIKRNDQVRDTAVYNATEITLPNQEDVSVGEPKETATTEQASTIEKQNQDQYEEEEEDSPVGEPVSYSKDEEQEQESTDEEQEQEEEPTDEEEQEEEPTDEEEQEPPVGEQEQEEEQSEDSSYADSVLEEVELNDSTYIFQEAPYYVTVEDALQTDFSTIDETAEYQVHLCAYHVHLDSRDPYLTYYLVANQQKEYALPTYMFGLSNVHQPLSPRTVQQQTGGNDTWHQFEAEFKDHLLDTLTQIHCFDFVQRQPEELDSNSMVEKLFKGFIVREPVQNQSYGALPIMYVVVDTSHIPFKTVTENQNHKTYVNATPYEILCSRSVRNKKVAADVTRFFQQVAMEHNSLDFHHVQRIDKTYVESPYVLYLCKNLSETTGVYTEEESAKHWFPPRIKDHGFGDILLFYLNHPDITEDAQRYAVFAKEKNTVFSETEFTSSQLLTLGPEISCFSFHKNRHQYMAVNASIIVDRLLS